MRVGPAAAGPRGEQSQLLVGGGQGPGSRGRDKEPGAGSECPARVAKHPGLARGCLAIRPQRTVCGVKTRGRGVRFPGPEA